MTRGMCSQNERRAEKDEEIAFSCEKLHCIRTQLTIGRGCRFKRFRILKKKLSNDQTNDLFSSLLGNKI